MKVGPACAHRAGVPRVNQRCPNCKQRVGHRVHTRANQPGKIPIVTSRKVVKHWHDGVLCPGSGTVIV